MKEEIKRFFTLDKRIRRRIVVNASCGEAGTGTNY